MFSEVQLNRVIPMYACPCIRISLRVSICVLICVYVCFLAPSGALGGKAVWFCARIVFSLPLTALSRPRH